MRRHRWADEAVFTKRLSVQGQLVGHLVFALQRNDPRAPRFLEMVRDGLDGFYGLTVRSVEWTESGSLKLVYRMADRDLVEIAFRDEAGK